MSTEEILNVIENCLYNQDKDAEEVLNLIRTNQIIIDIIYVQNNGNR